MPTLYEAIREAMEHIGGRVRREDIRSYINKNYPDRWQPAALTAHLYGCAINNPKAYIHHPHAKKVLFKNDDGSFEIYNPDIHGENNWELSDSDSDVPNEEYYEASISLERDLEDYLVRNIASLEAGLVFQERQSKTDVGFVDVLAKDKNGYLVVIEIKIGEAKDSAVGQVTRYMGWLAKTKPSEKIRGIIVASDFSDGAAYSASIIPGLTLLRFKINFEFERQVL